MKDTGDNDLVGYWDIKNKDIRVRYKINKIVLKNNKIVKMISFDVIKEIIDIAKTFENKDKIIFSNIIGKSEALLEPINKAKIASKTNSTILIEGESGTGKELFARSIHNKSQRKDGPFVVINCSGIPENLIESELFGYERGSFTGADPLGKKGKIELANNGTLFLDEIGDLPLHMQTKLLRVLQERTIDRIGGGKSIDVNIRIIAATHRNLKELVAQGEFRLDLFYRLNVIPIELPPLRDRDEDMFLCSDHIIKKLCSRMDKGNKVLSDEVKDVFQMYSWPGNLRELENVLEHGICFCIGEEIKLEDMPEYFLEKDMCKLKREKYKKQDKLDEEKSNYITIDKEYLLMNNQSLQKLNVQFENEVINQLIDVYGDTLEGKKTIAKKLNIGISTLYRKIN